jgi:hypothetical protein
LREKNVIDSGKNERNQAERGKKKSHNNDEMKKIFLTSDIMLPPDKL